MDNDGIGIVETKYFTFEELALESGQRLAPVTLAYETYGSLNSAHTNAILVLHAFSGDAHAAGYHEGDKKPGWWDMLIGPGKALDTDKYCVISSNVIGGCKGSTGPASVNPETGRPYALDFPIVTIADMVNAQRFLIDHLSIDKLLAVIGGSMGGMQVLQWVASYPDRIRSAIPIATTLKHSPQQIAFNEVGRQAVMADPDWNNGDYYDGASPERGLAIARMIGHITYMSDKSMEAKFSRKLRQKSSDYKFESDFEVGGYLKYKGDRFVERFDANSYLYITKALDSFDLSGSELVPTGKRIDVRFLVMSFKSDWLYPTYQAREIIRRLKMRFIDATFMEIKSTYGHDAFLLEAEEETLLIRPFLARVYENGGGNGR
jgi:homoserine O-acetyltransferase